MVRDGLSAQGATIAAPAITDSGRSNIILISVGLIVLVGLVCVVVHRFMMQKSAHLAASSMTRPVLAVLLVGTVLILAAASPTFDDAETRNLLVGGVVSLSSAAVAFYFASSGATEVRRDLLTATGATADVPNLKGKTVEQVQEIMSGTHLVLVLPDPRPTAGAVVSGQDPGAGTTVKGAQK